MKNNIENGQRFGRLIIVKEVEHHKMPKRVQPKPKPGWSEDDERNVHGICMYLMCSDSPEGYTDWIDWLKSLKERMKGE